MFQKLEIYLHIPFCVKKCSYCDFVSFGGCIAQEDAAYFRALREELAARASVFGAGGTYRVESIYIGGGTPSLADAEEIVRTLDLIRGAYRVDPRAEITIEANPGTVSRGKLTAYRGAGINRLSLGFQSLDDEVLRKMGRIHDSKEALRAYEDADRSGFSNISIDLIMGYPGQSPAVFEDTLRRVIALAPRHISPYSLIVEEGTPLFSEIAAGKTREPDQEADRIMYRTACALLPQHGYRRYELSNFALPGYESRHNLGYWTGVPYLGVGLGAASFAEGKRFSNTADLRRYLQSGPTEKTDPQSVEVLSRETRAEEFMMLGFRLADGPDPEAFAREFNCRYSVKYGERLRKLEAEGLIEPVGDGYRLSARGLDFGNLVFEEFV